MNFFRQTFRPMRLRSRLLILTLGTLLPLLIFGITSIYLIAEREQAVFKRGATERTRALLTAVDTELNGHSTSLLVLAGSRNLDSANLNSFYDEVQRLLPSHPHWLSVSLFSPGGKRLLDSRYSMGIDLSPAADQESFRQVQNSSEPVIGNLYLEDGVYQFAIRVPVYRQEKLQYILSVVVDPRAILALLTPQRLPSDWVGVVLDAKHRIVARTVSHQQYFGSKAAPSLRDALARATEGWFHGNTLEGTEVYTPFNRSAYSGWTVAIGIPASYVEISATRAIWMLSLGVLIAIVAAIALATALSRRISQPILDLADQAEALGHGQIIDKTASGLREVDNVRRALITAGEEIREREEALLAADRAKDEFLAMLGHELRNPLSALSSAAQVLQLAGAKDGSSSHAAAVIGRQVKHMTRLVDDLLDVSRAMTGKVNLTLRTLDLAEVAANAVGVLRSSGRLEEHVVQTHLRPAWIHADEARIEQIVLNLVGNALKFTPPGGSINIEVLPEGDYALLRVSDTGIGMPADLVPRVFDLFVQGERMLDRGPGGLGIGLTLVQRLAELHGGSAAVVSDGPGCGACFTVSLPLTAAPVRSLPAVTQAAIEPSSIRILLIEDNEDARLSLLSALSLYGYEVHQASDGLSGIEEAIRLQPDAAVIDIGLPGADGYAVARAIRLRSHKPDMLLIALSGYGQSESRRQAMAAGFDEYLTKPVAPAALAKLIESRLAARRDDAPQMIGK